MTRESERGGRGAGCGSGGGGGAGWRDGARWGRCGGDTVAVSALQLEDRRGGTNREFQKLKLGESTTEIFQYYQLALSAFLDLSQTLQR